MNGKKLSIFVGLITLLLLAVGVAGANQSWARVTLDTNASVGTGISYQGRLANASGVALNGTYTMRFILYDANAGGSAVWDSGNLNIAVKNGLFHVKLGGGQTDSAHFDGRALWLSIIVDGQTLSPRQEILPAPYALSLRPGADIVGGESIEATDAVIGSYAPATGAALRAEANGGSGIFSNSEQSYGVWGASNNSWGGFFTSSEGYGIRVDTTGSDHYDHGAFITSDSGYAVYAQSASNMAVRGESGNIAGLSQPLGSAGVVGIGAGRGMYGSSGGGVGMYGTSQDNYGIWGQSDNYRGVTGRTSRSDNNYGLYTSDNLYSLNINMSGSIMQVMQNNGSESLSPGDVVVFSGITEATTAVNAPMVQVSKTNVSNNTAVAGVVFSRFNIDAVDPALEFPDQQTQEALAMMDVTPAGSAAPGDYVLVVVQGPAQVNVSSLGTSDILPGDLLSTSGQLGTASKAPLMSINGVETAVPGTVFAKALEPLDASSINEMIYVYVTLH